MIEDGNNKLGKNKRLRLTQAGLAFIIFLSIVFWVLDTQGPEKDEYTMEHMFGTWALDESKDDSFIRFYTEKTDQTMGVEIINGKGEVNNCLGFKHKEFEWGYENYKPLRLNITMDDKQPRIFALKLNGKNELLLKMGTDINEMLEPDLFSSGTYNFHRIDKIPAQNSNKEDTK